MTEGYSLQKETELRGRGFGGGGGCRAEAGGKAVVRPRRSSPIAASVTDQITTKLGRPRGAGELWPFKQSRGRWDKSRCFSPPSLRRCQRRKLENNNKITRFLVCSSHTLGTARGLLTGSAEIVWVWEPHRLNPLSSFSPTVCQQAGARCLRASVSLSSTNEDNYTHLFERERQ